MISIISTGETIKDFAILIGIYTANRLTAIVILVNRDKAIPAMVRTTATNARRFSEVNKVSEYSMFRASITRS